jgi:hypothetical protein
MKGGKQMANFVFGGRNINGERISAPFRQMIRIGLWGPMNTYVTPPEELTVVASPADGAKLNRSSLPITGNVRTWEITALGLSSVTIEAKAGTQTWSSFVLDVAMPEHAIREGPYPAVNTRLPDSGTGYTTHKFVAPDARWGLPETVEAVKGIANAWALAHAGARLSIGDISLQSGGPIPGHASHQKGVDVDFWPVDTSGEAVHVSFKDASYSRATTQLLVNTIRTNSALAVEMIFFNDSKVTGVQPWPAHDEHLHVRFKAPYPIQPSKSFSHT